MLVLPLTMRTGCFILLLLAAPLMVTAQESQGRKSFMERLEEQTKINSSGMMGTGTSSFANKNFNVSAFNAKILSEKGSSITRNNNQFSFPNNSFAKQFQSGTFNGFAGKYATAANRTFDRSFDANKQPFSSKVLDGKTDRDSGKPFAAQDWGKPYHNAAKIYQGPEMTEVGSYSGTVILQNRDDMKWGQETLTSAQIKELLNRK